MPGYSLFSSSFFASREPGSLGPGIKKLSLTFGPVSDSQALATAGYKLSVWKDMARRAAEGKTRAPTGHPSRHSL